MSSVTLITSIPSLEREMLYCLSKADFISDLISEENVDFRAVVTIGFSPLFTTEFMVSDLFSADMEKTLLGQLEQLFRKKAENIEAEIARIKRQRGAFFKSDGK